MAGPTTYPRRGNRVGGTVTHESGEFNSVEFVKAAMAKSQMSQTHTITWEGFSFEIRYRPLGFLGIARCAAAAREVEVKNGTARLRFQDDVYLKTALLDMIIEAPFQITAEFLEHMDPELGAKFAEIVPSPESAVERLSAEKKE